MFLEELLPLLGEGECNKYYPLMHLQEKNEWDKKKKRVVLCSETG